MDETHILILIPAWVLGAADPTSGTASIHETIRGFGALVKQGWKPLRTIVIASWDGEEVSPHPALLGPLLTFIVVWFDWKHRVG